MSCPASSAFTFSSVQDRPRAQPRAPALLVHACTARYARESHLGLHHPIATGALGFVERAVGAGEQILWRLDLAVRHAGHAEADRHRDALALVFEAVLLDVQAHALG